MSASSMDGLFAGLRALPNVHPAVVHAPIVLLPLAFGLDLLGVAIDRGDVRRVASWVLWCGALGAALAFYTGHEAADLAQPYVTDEASALVHTHHNLGLATLIESAVLSIWRFFAVELIRIPLRIVYAMLAASVIATLVIGADVGGQLVYRHGVGVQAGADSLHGGTVRSTTSPHHH